MKGLKVAKYQILSSIGAIGVYYLIYSMVIILISALIAGTNGKGSSSGLDFSTMVFLFVFGLNYFKANFLFSQANNISRKTFFRGLVISIFPMTFAMSILDVTINRVQNIFAKCPTTFDMTFGNYKVFQIVDWTQKNDLQTILGTVFWQFAMYSTFLFLGILISLCYYRSNKIVKIIISVAPITLFVFSYNINEIVKDAFNIDISQILKVVFGFHKQNLYSALFSFPILIMLFSLSIYLLIKKAVIKG